MGATANGRDSAGAERAKDGVSPKALGKRGEQTRDRLKKAARGALAEQGAWNVKISDVAERGGVAAGLIYRYFPDLPSLLGEVLTDWAGEVFAEMPDVDAADPFSAVKATFAELIGRVDREPGLLAALFEGSRQLPAPAEVWRTGLDRLLRRQMKPLNEAFPGNAFGVEHLVAGLSGLVEGCLVSRYVRRGALALDAAGAPEEAGELLALIWHRAVHLENPPEGTIETYQHVAKIGAA